MEAVMDEYDKCIPAGAIIDVGRERLTTNTVQINSSPTYTGLSGPVKVRVIPKSGRVVSVADLAAASREGSASGRMTEGETNGWESTPPEMDN